MSPMARALPGFITHPLLSELGVEHGFGTRAAQAPEGLVRPHQVHGHTVIRAKRGQARDPLDADAVVSDDPALPVGIITADCVPILVASSSGAAVAALHAGWRGLASGVVEAGVRALADLSEPGAVAVIGPSIGRPKAKSRTPREGFLRVPETARPPTPWSRWRRRAAPQPACRRWRWTR